MIACYKSVFFLRKRLGQINVEGRSFFGAIELNSSARSFDDTFGDCQTETVSVGLGREIGQENAFAYFFRNAGSIVRNGNLYFLVRVESIE